MKLIASFTTAIMVAAVGFFVNARLNQQERLWKAQQELVHRRIAVYDSVKDNLNRIHCFINDIGTWKDDDPVKVIKYKRDVDHKMHEDRSVWSPETFQAYLDYMDGAAFRVCNGPGKDARIRTSDWQKKIAIPGWEANKWSDRLDPPDPEYNIKYKRLFDSLANDMALQPIKEDKSKPRPEIVLPAEKGRMPCGE